MVQREDSLCTAFPFDEHVSDLFKKLYCCAVDEDSFTLLFSFTVDFRDRII